MFTKEVENRFDSLVSVFGTTKSLFPFEHIKLKTWINRLQYGYYQTAVGVVRSYMYHSEEQREAKKTVPAATLSGVFRNRKDSGLELHSGILVLDVDDIQSKAIRDRMKNDLMKIPSTLCVHESVSGCGLAVYVSIDNYNPVNAYNYTRLYYTLETDIDFDRSTSNVSRLRYCSFDKDLRLNTEAKALIIPRVSAYVPDIKGGGIPDSAVDDLIDTVIDNGDDPTYTYDRWFRIGCAIASEYGASGEDRFVKVSSNHPDFNEDVCRAKYRSILSLGNFKSTKGTLMYALLEFN